LSELPKPVQSPLLEAIRLFKIGDIKGARLKLGLPPELVGDEEFIQGMDSLEQGLNLFIEGRQPEAIKHFQIAVPFIRDCYDKKRKIGSPKNIEKKICAFFKGL